MDVDVLVPRSLEEALELRAARPDAVPLAGGTDLWVEINFGRRRPRAVLDLSRVGELARWHREDGRVLVGAGMTFARIIDELDGCRPLVEAARSVASPQIRNRATIGGNVGTGSPAGDSIPVLVALDADVVVASAGGGRRSVPATSFFLGPKRTALAADELILGVEWREPHGAGSFAKVGVRNAMVIAVASVCVQTDEDAHAVHVGLGSVAPTVLRAPKAEAFAAEAVRWDEPGAPLGSGVAAEFGRLAARAASPIDDVRGTAAYRRRAVEVLAARALTWTVHDRRAA